MQTTATPHADIAITTDIDYTADLSEAPALVSSSLTEITDERGDFARGIEDVPFHDDVPAAPREARFPVAPGRVLCDRFVLTKLVGTGGDCSVFLARDLDADRGGDAPAFVALKTPRSDTKNPERALERLKREFEHARRLSHAGIVQVYELAHDGDVWFMTMEFLEGESLSSLLRRHASTLPPYLVRRTLRGTADALAYAHSAGIVHGDLNPANIVVMSGERIKLLDFGTACSDKQVASAAATPAYASPEVLEGAAPEIRDDIFSFACVAYQVLTGTHPFNQRSSTLARAEGAHPASPPELSEEQANALAMGLSWERHARPDDVRALAAVLAPDAPRRRVAIEDDYVERQTSYGDKRWWLLGGVSFIAMIAAVVATRFA